MVGCGHNQADAALPDEAFVAALASLPRMGPSRLNALLGLASPREVWRIVGTESLRAHLARSSDGRLCAITAELAEQWRCAVHGFTPEALWQSHVLAGIGVAIRTSAAYPTAFIDDIDSPPIVFSTGDPDTLVGPRVAVVGTRDCTRYGYDIARQFGAELSEAGVSVVSGLALGIDGAAHAGALDADGTPIGVIGSGLDVIYPRQNAKLWRGVARHGVLLGEYALGARPLGWHFPARNRLIAALADVVVIVESQENGGAMITADEAARRSVDVMAVPGPVTAKASAGTNRLLSEGAIVARDAIDVLVRLGMSDGARRLSVERRAAPTPGDKAVLAVFDWQPATLDQLVGRTGADLFELARSLDRLSEGGWIDQRGGWYERVAKPGG